MNINSGSGLVFVVTSLLAACTTVPTAEQMPTGSDAQGVVPALSYYQTLQRMPAAEMFRERTALAAQPASPAQQLRLAMLLGHPRAAQDMNRALALLDSLLKSQDPAAQTLYPLARLLADNYNERLKIDAQHEKQGTQLKELLKDSQRKTLELQEKLNGLADIERSLPPRSRSTRPLPAAGAK